MIPEVLAPHFDFLKEEYVLVQAWKKTASYIRRHNWYADTIELDLATVNLPRFIGSLRERLTTPEGWKPGLLRMVAAPKSQQWMIDRESGWRPAGKRKSDANLRPLAHVPLADQVAASAILLCMADTVETMQGDPREDISDASLRQRVLSYGNRLFCDQIDDRLRHRWGSGRLYRQYFSDYRTFVERSSWVAKEVKSTGGERAVVVHSDLQQFYDRVRPDLLIKKVRSVIGHEADDEFLTLASQILQWTWHPADEREVLAYARKTAIPDFEMVALPQGLVAAGFFANVVLLDFDAAIRASFGQEIFPGLSLVDACRYVDDLRIVLVDSSNTDLAEIEEKVQRWLRSILDRRTRGLMPSEEKTQAAVVDGDERPLVRQSRNMQRIQSAISGGFDAAGGEEILSAIQGLIRAQVRYSEQQSREKRWAFAPVADVGDATVARFAAARFRTTYRSLRPLLECMSSQGSKSDAGPEPGSLPTSVVRTQQDLDDDVRAFALGLIENWVDDPSNVRLLRIGLDLWPDPAVLRSVLDLLWPFIQKGGLRGPPRRVARYCLAEILRAGAIETGIVQDDESLPNGLNLDEYRKILTERAASVVALPPASTPWYLRQQALLFLAVHEPKTDTVARSGQNRETKHYRRLILFLRGVDLGVTKEEFASMAILARRSFLDADQSAALVADRVDARTVEEIARRDPAFASELINRRPELVTKIAPRVRDDLCLRSTEGTNGWQSIAQIVLEDGINGFLRNEPAILNLLRNLLENWPEDTQDVAITPNEVFLQFEPGPKGDKTIKDVRIVASRVSAADSIYLPPLWCPAKERWRFQLGYLLRFILTAQRDFTKRVQQPNWREERNVYRRPTSHWFQRRYEFFGGQPEFGDDWLPISDWLEQLLYALLRWPGCRESKEFSWIARGLVRAKKEIGARIEVLCNLRGENGLWLIPVAAPVPANQSRQRPFRACIVQTVIPEPEDLRVDLTQSNQEHRRRHRNHLSAALAAVESMLRLRDTHLDRGGRLDWLILPELSVHPQDVRTHLIPFARAHRAIVLAGLTYEEIFFGQPLVNSAIWVVPIQSPDGGLQVITRRQGKWNLSLLEQQLNTTTRRVQGFRPCQWLLGYEWSDRISDAPLWLTAAVCYDATDLGLAAALRNHSDVFAIPSLNLDVGTFDQMAAALHYHMFQYVVVANNGKFGGSNVYAPFKDAFVRQVFHLHGQPQASIAFFEIDDIQNYLRRKRDARRRTRRDPPRTPRPLWKFPPAGL